MLGRAITKELGKYPQQWKTVYAIARSQKEDYPSNVIFRHIDLTGSAEDMAAESLKGVHAEYVFFAAYLQKDTDQENWDVNGGQIFQRILG
jgi:hypothetical protein